MITIYSYNIAEGILKNPTTEKLPELLKKYCGSLTPQGVMSLTLASEGEAAVMDETIYVLKELSDM